MDVRFKRWIMIAGGVILFVLIIAYSSSRLMFYRANWTAYIKVSDSYTVVCDVDSIRSIENDMIYIKCSNNNGVKYIVSNDNVYLEKK